MSKVHGWRNLRRSSHDAIWLELDFVPNGVANLLTPFGANKRAEVLLAAPPHRTGKTGVGHRSDRCCQEDPARDQRTSSGQDPVGAAHAGLS
jgi:hypothetical protein